MAGLRKALLGVPVVVLLVLGVFAATPFFATCGGHDEVVTSAVLRCPRAVELLGDDAHPVRLGMACGSTKISGASGNANWDLPYTGSRGRGTVTFAAEKRSGSGSSSPVFSRSAASWSLWSRAAVDRAHRALRVALSSRRTPTRRPRPSTAG
ncbi:MAG: hypothetical protein H0T42_11900 [Deltaproteobacteria bacterium]|nr:hypothetical protein [Deltaproteobacteria bacterium]